MPSLSFTAGLLVLASIGLSNAHDNGGNSWGPGGNHANGNGNGQANGDGDIDINVNRVFIKFRRLELS